MANLSEQFLRSQLDRLKEQYQSCLEANRRLYERVRAINQKARELLDLLDPNDDFRKLLGARSLADPLEDVIVLVKAILHDIESREREAIMLKAVIGGFHRENKTLEEEVRDLELINEALEAEIKNLCRELKATRKRNKGKRRK